MYRAISFDLQQHPDFAGRVAESYWIQHRFTIETEHGVELAIYTHTLTTIANRPDTLLRVQALHCIARLLGVAIGLNRWLDVEQGTRLNYDADLQRKLFPACEPFQTPIADIIGRHNAERLARRFPETFKE